MDTIIEKGNNGLFENEIEFQGIYAKHLRMLKEEIGVFDTAREGYLTSVILGCLHKDYQKINKDVAADDVKPLSIFGSDLVLRKSDLRYLYRVIMLWDESGDISVDDYMNRAFRDDSDTNRRDYLKKNMAIFNKYAMIGVEYLYDIFYECRNTDEVCDIVNAKTKNFYLKYNELNDKELPDFNPKFD